MRVLVSEYLTTSSWPESLVELPSEPRSWESEIKALQSLAAHLSEHSLVDEGMGMVTSIVADLLRIPDVEVHVARDFRWPEMLWTVAWRLASGRQRGFVPAGAQGFIEVALHEVVRFHERIVWQPVTAEQPERTLLQRLSTLCDTTLFIAPEFQSLLAERCRWAEHCGAQLLGSSSAAVEACADKLALCQRLQAAGVPTIDTFEFDIERLAAELPFPVVIKPRDGAGSLATYVLLNRLHLAWQLPMMRTESLLQNAVWQPFVAGRALSVGVLISTETGRAAEALPVCDQILSGDGRLKYFGGRVPADCARAAEVQQIALAACEQVAGLRGYVGVDMLLPDDPQSPPLVVEINPRLTTSYLGYQSLCLDNLAERILFPDRDWPPLRWRDRQVAFAPHGFTAPSMD